MADAEREAHEAEIRELLRIHQQRHAVVAVEIRPTDHPSQLYVDGLGILYVPRSVLMTLAGTEELPTTWGGLPVVEPVAQEGAP